LSDGRDKLKYVGHCFETASLDPHLFKITTLSGVRERPAHLLESGVSRGQLSMVVAPSR
jgi:hypothetical protein